MKTPTRLALSLILAAALTGCGSAGETAPRPANTTTGVNEVLEAGMAAADSANAAANSADTADSPESTTAIPTPEPIDESAVLSTTEGIDIDLTILSSTMVYAEVYTMVFAPDDYIGKTIKMNGLFASTHSEVTGKYYFACIVQDATACCAQGIEFVPAGDFTYPDDFPEDGTEVTVTGVFDTYKEGEYTYATLRDAEFS